MIRLRVPATSANLGPGFDCLGLALDLWNEVSFERAPQPGFIVEGEGAARLNGRLSNLLLRAADAVYEECGAPAETLRVTSINHIPLSSGLGSSSAAIAAGIFGANEILGGPMDAQGLLKLGTRLEGHPDNIAAALEGGLVISIQQDSEILTHRLPLPDLTAVIVKPDVDLPTHTARLVLPGLVSREDVVFNLGRTALVVEALREGDLELLQKVMDDRLHQAPRLERVPGGREAFETARIFGAAALSGAGPSIIIFVEPEKASAARDAVASVFEQSGIAARGWVLHTSERGLHLLQ